MGKILEKIKAFWDRLGEPDVEEFNIESLPSELRGSIKAEGILAAEGASGGLEKYKITEEQKSPRKASKGRRNNKGSIELDK